MISVHDLVGDPLRRELVTMPRRVGRALVYFPEGRSCHDPFIDGLIGGQTNNLVTNAQGHRRCRSTSRILPRSKILGLVILQHAALDNTTYLLVVFMH